MEQTDKTVFKKKQKLSIEKLKSGQFAVVDLNSPYSNFSKVLTKAEEQVFKATGQLPLGVTESTRYSVVAVVNSYKSAKAIVEGSKRVYPDRNFGVFKSFGQVKKVKQLLKQGGNK